MTAPTATLTEADFQRQVIELAGLLGWRTLHVRRSIGKGSRWTTATSVAGWPDLLCWRPRTGEVIAVELKSEGGKVTPEQRQVLDELAACGIPAYLWRPSSWSEVEAVLTGDRS